MSAYLRLEYRNNSTFLCKTRYQTGILSELALPELPSIRECLHEFDSDWEHSILSESSNIYTVRTTFFDPSLFVNAIITMKYPDSSKVPITNLTLLGVKPGRSVRYLYASLIADKPAHIYVETRWNSFTRIVIIYPS